MSLFSILYLDLYTVVSSFFAGDFCLGSLTINFLVLLMHFSLHQLKTTFELLLRSKTELMYVFFCMKIRYIIFIT